MVMMLIILIDIDDYDDDDDDNGVDVCVIMMNCLLLHVIMAYIILFISYIS
jgi:hypothetical protein